MTLIIKNELNLSPGRIVSLYVNCFEVDYKCKDCMLSCGLDEYGIHNCLNVEIDRFIEEYLSDKDSQSI